MCSISVRCCVHMWHVYNNKLNEIVLCTEWPLILLFYCSRTNKFPESSDTPPVYLPGTASCFSFLFIVFDNIYATIYSSACVTVGLRVCSVSLSITDDNKEPTCNKNDDRCSTQKVFFSCHSIERVFSICLPVEVMRISSNYLAISSVQAAYVCVSSYTHNNNNKDISKQNYTRGVKNGSSNPAVSTQLNYLGYLYRRGLFFFFFSVYYYYVHITSREVEKKEEIQRPL